MECLFAVLGSNEDGWATSDALVEGLHKRRIPVTVSFVDPATARRDSASSTSVLMWPEREVATFLAGDFSAPRARLALLIIRALRAREAGDSNNMGEPRARVLL